MERCDICTDHEDSSEAGKLQKLYIKGYENLIEQCIRISDSSLLERLERKWTRNIPIAVHRRCRALFLQKNKSTSHALNVKKCHNLVGMCINFTFLHIMFKEVKRS